MDTTQARRNAIAAAVAWTGKPATVSADLWPLPSYREWLYIK